MEVCCTVKGGPNSRMRNSLQINMCTNIYFSAASGTWVPWYLGVRPGQLFRRGLTRDGPTFAQMKAARLQRKLITMGTLQISGYLQTEQRYEET